MKKGALSVILFFTGLLFVFGQGYNYNYLIGDDIAAPPWTFHDKGIIKIDSINFNVFGSSRKMKFRAAQANISNDTGALLFYTNGCWIANALEDTMQNGSGLATDLADVQWCNTGGIQWPQSSLILPMPDDSSKYFLFHHGNSYANPPSNLPLICFYSAVDMSLNNGLGGVIAGQKKVTLIQDKLLPGFTACRHANGRDWWIVILRDSSDLIFVTLLSPQGVQTPVAQSLGIPHYDASDGQLSFSPDGRKFAYRIHGGNFGNATNEVRVFDFDRCSGIISNPRIVSWPSQYGSLGLAFSSNSKFLYTVSDFDTIYQINTDTSNIQASMTVVAVNDGYFSPFPPQQSNFWLMYLAANGKIIISSSNSTVDLHYINYPDSAGLACDVKLHALPMPCFTFRSHVNHPNYYLGCDTTQTTCPCFTGMAEHSAHDFKFTVSPNPGNGAFVIKYLLPQNQPGVFEVFDINGRKVYSQRLPQWSTKQEVDASKQLHSGVYFCTIASNGEKQTKKLVIINY